MKRKWLLVSVFAAICAVAAAGLTVTLLPPEAPAPETPNVSVDANVKPKVMTSVYKAYANGDELFAISTIRNNGTQPVRSFQITYSFPGYVRQTGQEDYPVILPGQTVLDHCYPTFPEAKMKAINRPVSAEPDVSYSYQGSGRTKGTSRRFELRSGAAVSSRPP